MQEKKHAKFREVEEPDVEEYFKDLNARCVIFCNSIQQSKHIVFSCIKYTSQNGDVVEKYMNKFPSLFWCFVPLHLSK